MSVLTGAAVLYAQSKDAFVSYPCTQHPAEQAARLLRPLLVQIPTADVVVDARKNRILLSGPEEAHVIARKLLRPAAPTDERRMRIYSVNATQQERFMADMEQRFGAAIRLVNDPQAGRVYVTSTPAIHAQIARILTTPTPTPAPTPAPSSPSPEASERPLARFLPVARDRLPRLERQLSAIFADRITHRRVQQRDIYLLALRKQDAFPVELEYDRTRSGVLIGGPAETVAQLSVLIDSLSKPSPIGRQTKVFRLQRESHASLGEVIRQNSGQAGPPSPGGMGRVRPARMPSAAMLATGRGAQHRAPAARFGVPPDRFGGAARPLPSPHLNPTARDANVQRARYLYQEPAAGNPGPNAPPEPQAANNAPPPALPQFEGVEIQSLPDLDVIILRGRDQDLAQLAEIIEQLERISQEAQPKVHIVPLKFAAAERVAELIGESLEDLTAGRQGKVSVRSLAKPNALLVIGWGESVDAVGGLIAKLDTPVAAETQSAVFRLRYSSAQEVLQALNDFFNNRPGLGPVITGTVDTRTNTLIIHAAPRDLLEVRKLVRDLDQPGSGKVNRARIFPIRNALAADIAATLQSAIDATAAGADSAILELQTFDADGRRILRSGTLERVRITPNPRNNTLIVSSPQQNLELLAELIRQLDSPVESAKIKVFRVENGDASALLQTLRSLVPTQTAATSGPQLPSAPEESSLVPLRFSVDVRSNSIIATGSEGDLRIVEALLVKLDQNNTLNRKTTVYHLKNSPALDVAAAVNQFIVNRRQLEQATPGEDNPFQEIEREVVVVPEPVANKLILAATDRYFQEIQALIEKLDEQPPQVMIQVLIAEVALNDSDEFGVELGVQDSVLFDRSLLGDLITTTNSQQFSTPGGVTTAVQEIIQAATNVPGFAFNSTNPLGNSGSQTALTGAGDVGSQAISNFAVGRGNETLGFGGLVLSASSQNVSLLIRALQESRRVDVLSRPQIRTLDNQPAFIQVGQRVPRITGSTVNQNGQSNTVALENVGLILGVTPRISPDGNVVMEIDAEKSALGPEQDGIPVAVSIDGTVIRSPRIDTTTAQATVSAASGETIILGGLITENVQTVHRRVPYLSDIPLLRHLFRYDGQFARRTELLIILTPHVVRTREDSERLKQMEFARMSWCAADVHRVHGDVGFELTAHAEMLGVGAPEVIYPDVNPSGDAMPTPASNAPVAPAPFPTPLPPPQPEVGPNRP